MTVLFDVVPFEKAFAFSPREVLSQRCHHSKQQRPPPPPLLSKITRTLDALKTAVLEEGRKQEAGEG